jgi:signal transduction histidine kinase
MKNINILVVEDEAIVAEDIAYRLEGMGYRVVDLVATGEAAICEATRLCESADPLDLVLMDIMLKGKMDGIEAAQHIRTQLNVPVIYLTANADEVTLQRSKVAQPFGYILKPFKERELKATIEIALSQHQVEMDGKKALVMAEELQQKAQQLSQLKSRFISMVSHEFRTPLAVIKIAAENLHCYENMPKDKKQRHFERIQAATESMERLLEDVLTLGQTDDLSPQHFSFAPLEVISFCRELLESPQWSDDNFCVKFITDCDRLYADVEGRLLWHLLNNLLSNAVKYSPQGGIITLKLTTSSSNVYLQVQDQGIGIPLEDQKSLFEPFYRAGNVGKIAGTGLGLAIAKRSVEIHGGQISVESEVNQGTTFTVTLPLKSSQPCSPRFDLKK